MFDQDNQKKIRILEDRIEELSIEKNILNLLQSISYPYGLKEFASKLKLKDKNINMINENYKFSLKIREDYEDDFLEHESIKFRSGLEFLVLAKNATLYMKPILLYYGLNHIYSGLIDLIFENPPVSKSHGILNHPILKKDKEIDWFISITLNSGFFRKLIISVEFLFGGASIFSEFFWKDKHLIRKEIKKIIFASDQYHKKIEIDLEKSIENLESLLESGNPMYSFNIILSDYLVLFALCSTLRYYNDIWSIHLLGKYKMFDRMEKVYNKIFDNLQSFIIFMQRSNPTIFSSVENVLDYNLEFRERKYLNLLREKEFYLSYSDQDIDHRNLTSLGLDTKEYKAFIIPSGISAFKNLKRLKTGYFEIIQFPDDLYSLNHLERLDLSKSKLKSLPENIGKLTNLKYLLLPELKVLPESIVNLNLEEIFIDHFEKIATIEQKKWLKSLIGKGTCRIFPNQDF